MLYKNLPSKRILKIRMALDGISAIFSLLKGEFSVFRAIWKAHKSYRKLRSEYSKTNVSSYPSGVYNHSIVYQYFIKGIKTFSSLPG